MKKQLLFVFALFFSTWGFSQGIEFENGSWKDVLKKSKQTGKPIFVDVYTSWCGPCKKMNKEIFPLAEVGKVYNAKFICYKVDAEKGDGIDIARKYLVKSYPTFLFIRPDGSLFFRSFGSTKSAVFIELATIALADMNDPRPLVEWEKEYLIKKKDPQFLVHYMNKRAKFGLSNALLLDEYLKLLPDEECYSDRIKEIYEQEAGSLKITSFAFENFQKNIAKFNDGFVVRILRKAIFSITDEAARLKNEQMLATAISLNDQLHARKEFPEYYPFPKVSTLISNDQICLRYYETTGEIEKYLKYATVFCSNKLMKISPDSLYKKDKANLRQIEKIAFQDSLQFKELKTYLATAETLKVSAGLNSTAWHVFEKVSDRNTLEEALDWSDRAVGLMPKNPHWVITNANLHYKLGQKEEAITLGEKALRLADKSDIDEYKEIEGYLLKIKAGEKTWE